MTSVDGVRPVVRRHAQQSSGARHRGDVGIGAVLQGARRNLVERGGVRRIRGSCGDLDRLWEERGHEHPAQGNQLERERPGCLDQPARRQAGETARNHQRCQRGDRRRPPPKAPHVDAARDDGQPHETPPASLGEIARPQGPRRRQRDSRLDGGRFVRGGAGRSQHRSSMATWAGQNQNASTGALDSVGSVPGARNRPQDLSAVGSR
jgi:hypothetical protein